MPANQPQIAVIGAGPAGLTFAAVFHHLLRTQPVDGFKPELTVFEKDTSRASRDLGGTLDLHGPTGQRALKVAGLWDEFNKVARWEGEAIKIIDKAGKVWLQDDGKGRPDSDTPIGRKSGGAFDLLRGPDGRPEIDRGLLNALLIDSLPEGAVQWGKGVASVEPVGGGKHQIYFLDGTSQEFDLVVGSDGTWGKTRRLLTSTAPEYSGVTMVEVRISGIDSRLPHVGQWVGQGMTMAYSENKAVFAQRNSGERLRIYYSLRIPETWPKESGIDWSSLSTARAGLKQMFDGWSKEVLEMLDLADEPAGTPGLAVRPLYQLPPDNFMWVHQRGITLIGDSAHLMTPYAGEGANVAMADGTDLAEAIFDAVKTNPTQMSDALDAAVKIYEQKMVPRAEASMAETFGNLNAFMNDGAPQSGLTHMIREGKLPADAIPGLD